MSLCISRASNALRRSARSIMVAGVLLIGALCTGCAPRGETKSLDEVLNAARERFVAAQQGKAASGLSADAARSVDVIAKALAQASGSGEAKAVEAALGELLPKAGYTSRAAMNEVQKQFGQIASAGGAEPAQMKLAAARAYTVLAGELETTAFGL